MPILEARKLTKRFGNFTAAADVSFSLKEGEILGLLGPNGAGKTTIIQILLGVLTPSAGEVFYFGKPLLKHREEILEQVNFSSTYTNLPWSLTVKENLTFISYLYDIPNRSKRRAEVVEIFRLNDLLHQRTDSLSAGEQTRLNLAKAFINSPKVLLLDEPTASLDPEVADYIRKFVLAERERGHVSIIFTSHNMAEVEEICDRVIFINDGKIVADDTPENLARSIRTARVEFLIRDGLERTKEYSREQNFRFTVKGRFVVIEVEEKQIPEFLRGLMERGVIYDEISIEKPTLEDYFLHVAAKNVNVKESV